MAVNNDYQNLWQESLVAMVAECMGIVTVYIIPSMPHTYDVWLCAAFNFLQYFSTSTTSQDFCFAWRKNLYKSKKGWNHYLQKGDLYCAVLAFFVLTRETYLISNIIRLFKIPRFLFQTYFSKMYSRTSFSLSVRSPWRTSKFRWTSEMLWALRMQM